MKDKKGIIIGICIVIIVILIGVFFSTKLYYLYKYNIVSVTDEEYREFKSRLQIKETITIETQNINEEEYISYNNVKIRNDFKNFEILENGNDDNRQYMLYEDGNVKASFVYGLVTDSLFYVLCNELNIQGFKEENINLSIDDRVQFFKKYNIENDADLIEFLAKYDYQKNNVFTSTEKMKENYLVKFITSFLMSGGENVTLINGDYEGYILNMYENKEVFIFKDNKKYVFTFIETDYFTEEYIKELLDTVIIEDN